MTTAQLNSEGTNNTTSLTLRLKEITERCRTCQPITPLECTGCHIWKFKNELLELNEKLTREDYAITLLNTLKNGRRLLILGLLAESSLTIPQLQKELRKRGCNHSQQTIMVEYVEPLIIAELVKANSDRYKATAFGCEISHKFKHFPAVAEVLPPHSECYEEGLIGALFESPRTFQELKSLIPVKSLSRILGRLQEVNILTKDDDNNYVYYFRSRRHPKLEKLSSTQERVHNNIPEEGITAEALATRTGISLRRTYKYLRKLRGKKLAFKRIMPKKYSLTTEGRQIALLLRETETLLMEYTQAAEAFAAESLQLQHQICLPDSDKNGKSRLLEVLVKRQKH